MVIQSYLSSGWRGALTWLTLAALHPKFVTFVFELLSCLFAPILKSYWIWSRTSRKITSVYKIGIILYCFYALRSTQENYENMMNSYSLKLKNRGTDCCAGLLMYLHPIAAQLINGLWLNFIPELTWYCISRLILELHFNFCFEQSKECPEETSA